jgi:hypothetical protein
MSDEPGFEISIPCDDDGYILLQCEHCGTFFKISTDDMRDDRLLELYCPCCGLISDCYLTGDAIELAQAIVQNYALDMIYDAFKDLEKSTRKGIVQFKAGKKPKHVDENPIRSGIDALEISRFECCRRSAKIKPLLKMTGCYCPFCGVKNYEVK